MVEVLLDADEIAAVQLLGTDRVVGIDRRIPAFGYRPVGDVAALARGRESVEEDLIPHSVVEPSRRRMCRGDPEVVGIGYVVVMEARPVQPGVAGRAAFEQEAVVGQWVVQRDVGDPPGDLVAVHALPVDRGVGQRRLRIGHRSDADTVGLIRRRHADPDPNAVTRREGARTGEQR